MAETKGRGTGKAVRQKAADNLARHLEALSFKLSQPELDELGGILKAAGVTVHEVDRLSGKQALEVPRSVTPFALNVAAYKQAGDCW